MDLKQLGGLQYVNNWGDRKPIKKLINVNMFYNDVTASDLPLTGQPLPESWLLSHYQQDLLNSTEIQNKFS